MNNQSKQTGASKCCDFCSTTHYTTNEVIVNAYKCDQKHFVASDMWNLQKTKKEFIRRTGI